MSMFKVPKYQSNENIPLLFSTDDEKSRRVNQFVSKSDSYPRALEVEISLENDVISTIDVDNYDFVQISNSQAIIHIVKASIGTGVLALPSALRYSGIVLGSLSILILSIISVYSVRLLLRVVDHLRSSSPTFIKNLDYEMTVKLCFEKSSREIFRKFSWMHRALLVSLTMAQLGVLSSYHVFVAENTKALLDNYTSSVSLWIYQIGFFFLLCPLLFIKTLDKLSYFAQLANIFMIISLTISIVYCLQDPLPIQNLALFKISDATPLFFGIVIFSFESINLINPIENNLKKKRNILDICGVLNISSSIVIIIYLLIGICGYWKFGDDVGSSLILSIPLEPWYYLICKPFYIISILISYAIQGYVMVNIFWKKIEPKLKSRNTKTAASIIIRVGIVVTTTILAVAVPYFDLMVSLVGAISGAFITFIFPSICNSVMVISTKEDRFWRCQLLINASILLIGITGFVLGTYSSLINIIRAFTA